MINITRTTDFKVLAALNENVQNLHARLHPDIFKPYNQAQMEESMQRILSAPNCHAFLASIDGKAAGSIVMTVKESAENAFHFELKRLYIDQISVLPEYQKTGTGKLLLATAEALAGEISIRRIELDHWTANSVAAAYFRKNGYSLFREMLVKLI